MNTALFAPADHPTMAPRRLARAYFLESKYAFLRMLRNPGFAIPTLTFPLFFYLLIGFIFGAFRSRNPAIDVPLLMFCGFATMSAMTPGMFGFGIGLAQEREQGLYTMKRALPMPRFSSLFGSVAMSVLSTVGATVILAIVAVVIGVLQIGWIKIAAVVAIVSIGSIPFAAIGLFIGSLTSGRAAPAVANIIYLLLTYLSGLFIPLPESLRYLPLGSPAFYLNQLALAAADARPTFVGGIANHIAILLLVTVLFLGLAARRLQRVG